MCVIKIAPKSHVIGLDKTLVPSLRVRVIVLMGIAGTKNGCVEPEKLEDVRMMIKDVIELSDKLDKDNEMEIEIDTTNSYVNIWIDEQEAKDIINHLQKVFTLCE